MVACAAYDSASPWRGKGLKWKLAGSGDCAMDYLWANDSTGPAGQSSALAARWACNGRESVVRGVPYGGEARR